VRAAWNDIRQINKSIGANALYGIDENNKIF
jgi:hypothetical protein